MTFASDRIHTHAKQNHISQERSQCRARSRFKFDPEAIVENLQSKIVGQTSVLSSLEDILFTVKADLQDNSKPLASVLLGGPTGVGKTETVKQLAHALTGSSDNLCRIDMNTLNQAHYGAALTGSPPGYVGSKEGFTLFDEEKIKGSFTTPGVVLLDEIEKANPDIARVIMNIFDSGKFVLSSTTKSIDFSNTLVFMTTNLGCHEISRANQRSSKFWRRPFKQLYPANEAIFHRSLKRFFDLEFINRIDTVLLYSELSRRQLGSILDIELATLNKRLQKYNTSIAIDSQARFLLLKNINLDFGAREIARELKRRLIPPLSRALLEFDDGTHFIATTESDAIRVTPT